MGESESVGSGDAGDGRHGGDADRPQFGPAQLRIVGQSLGVCIRPVMHRVTDTHTGETRLAAMPCKATRDSICAPCADGHRRLRMHQCREGWHLEEEPPAPEPKAPDDPEPAEEEDSEGTRRVRSTRRRDDAKDLPKRPVEDRTVGQVIETDGGKRFRPSMFMTMTLPSYGRVTAEGAPVDPGRYDYRRAALDALHFPKLFDRWVQNLRRCAGYQVQYFAAIEPQRRLAPHVHVAARGMIPRKIIRQVTQATYHQLWWPQFDQVVYPHPRLPVWDPDTCQYLDPETKEPLPTWEQALADVDEQAEPAHVVRFGRQDDIQGLIPNKASEDRVGYLCKYLTKDIAHTHDAEDGKIPPARQAHIDRLHEEVRWLPCSPTCSNWLRYGTQPKDPRADMTPGRCRQKAHDKDNLGLGGRRVLVSRRWTGKTLTDHRADRADVVRATLEAAGFEPEDHDELSATPAPDGTQRFRWEYVNSGTMTPSAYAHAMQIAIRTRCRWEELYDEAKRRAKGVPDHETRLRQAA